MPRSAKSNLSPVQRIWPFILIAILLLIISFLLFQSWQRNIVVHVIDGDSLELADGRHVRLLGVNAPERGRCEASEAASFLRQEALGRHVRLKHTGTDSYSRTLAIVIVEDLKAWVLYMRGYISRFHPLSPQSPVSPPYPQFYDPLLNRALVSRGLAKYNFAASPDYKATMKAAHDYARTNNLGIYSPTCRSSEPEGRSSDSCSIKGNIRAGKHTYFLPDCPNYSDVIIDASYGDEWFCTEVEATAAGFTKSPTCR